MSEYREALQLVCGLIYTDENVIRDHRTFFAVNAAKALLARPEPELPAWHESAARALLARGESEDEGYTPVPPRSVREPAAAEKAREPLELLEEADKFIQGFAGSTEAGFARKARADRWRRRYSEYISSIPLPSPPDATGEAK